MAHSPLRGSSPVSAAGDCVSLTGAGALQPLSRLLRALRLASKTTRRPNPTTATPRYYPPPHRPLLLWRAPTPPPASRLGGVASLPPSPPPNPLSRMPDAASAIRCPVSACQAAVAGHAARLGLHAHLCDALTAANVNARVLVAKGLRGRPHCDALSFFNRTAVARRAFLAYTSACGERQKALVAAPVARGVAGAPQAGGATAAPVLTVPPQTTAGADERVAAGVAAPPQPCVCPLLSSDAALEEGEAIVAHLRASHTGADVPAPILVPQRLGGCRHCHRLYSVETRASGHRPLNYGEPNCPSHLLMKGAGRRAEAAARTAAGGAPASAADLSAWETSTCCVVSGCTTTFRGAVTSCTLPAHLSRVHLLAAVPGEWVSSLQLGGCRSCGRPYRTAGDHHGRTSPSRHKRRCPWPIPQRRSGSERTIV